MADDLELEVVACVDGLEDAGAADLSLVKNGFTVRFPDSYFRRVAVFD